MGPMTIGAAKANRIDGPYERVSDPIFSVDTGGEIEDPFVWQGEDGVYHMIAKDMTGKICGEKHAGMYANSNNGLKWDIVQGHKAYSRHVVWENGVSQVMGSFERPFLLIENGKATCLFAATGMGPGGFSRNSITWNMSVPLG
ncbi:glycoside hydrolase family protein [Paenibacillus roseipurpureus]|uniref:Uncharacterized protein n=1 Tax=Paenibacillus roseopurpureus TaxID=2918901 RepID=A0AA96RJ31_9BACL|nr:hypothetical protein [Paenibacillus sp. MBLB1832]WNR42874.1 hypothetical protein MJB10_17335 [Paenibacillus sp. MBLB1832]